MKDLQPLLTPFKSNNLDLPNRVVMAPMTRNRAVNKGNVPIDELQGEYYAQRASAGLIISEGSQVSKRAVGYINTPGIYSKEQVTGWKKVTQKVHDAGGRIFIQLWHVGRCHIHTFTMANCRGHLQPSTQKVNLIHQMVFRKPYPQTP